MCRFIETEGNSSFVKSLPNEIATSWGNMGIFLAEYLRELD
jgi:hypothetical protein